MENRQWFIFYYSFYEAISELPDENKLELYEAISQYSFTFTEPTNLSWISKAMRKLIKPQLDANNKRYFNWKKQKWSKTEANEKQMKSKHETKEKEKDKEKDKENILSSKEDKEQSSYWDENINNCLEIIKKYNWWIIDWTQKEQRIYWKNLIWKLEKIDSVKNWNYTRAQVLQMILEIVSKNSYHSQKISWPKKIYYELWGLMQICKQEISKQKDHSIPFIPWIW